MINIINNIGQRVPIEAYQLVAMSEALQHLKHPRYEQQK